MEGIRSSSFFRGTNALPSPANGATKTYHAVSMSLRGAERRSNPVFAKNESAFACLYSDLPSQHNIPFNVLVGLEFLKSGFGWSDEELYDEFLYNVQVCYDLGYHELWVGEFDLRM